jgi:hypothetical protein
MKQHPFTSKDGLYCDWCQLPAANSIHLEPPMDWGNDDGSHALVCGWTMAALHSQAGDAIVASVEPVMDENGYTNKVRMTTNAGSVYIVTITKA